MAGAGVEGELTQEVHNTHFKSKVKCVKVLEMKSNGTHQGVGTAERAVLQQ